MKKIVQWQCEVCGTKYGMKHYARMCEKSWVPPRFKRGDRVGLHCHWQDYETCSACNKKGGRTFRITEISQPKPNFAYIFFLPVGPTEHTVWYYVDAHCMYCSKREGLTLSNSDNQWMVEIQEIAPALQAIHASC